MKCTRTEIIGCGHYLPAKVLTNDDLSKMVDTNDEWISTRTGIRSRHVVAEGELTSDMAMHAVEMAMQNAGVTAADLDLVVVATLTPDNTTPSVAARIAGRLGVKVGTPAFDIGAACSGFVYAMTMVDNMIRRRYWRREPLQSNRLDRPQYLRFVWRRRRCGNRACG